MPVANSFNDKNILIDFPPFGQSWTIKSPWTIYDYAKLTCLVLKKEKVDECDIICHSFGARVAVVLCANKSVKVNHLIITAGAGIRRKGIKLYAKKLSNKIKRILNKKAIVGSKEYIELSPVMKKTFSNIVEEDLSNLSKTIIVKTLLIYGDKDKETPLYIAKKFKKNIKNSKLIIYKGCGHFAYLEKYDTFILDTKIFMKE